MGLGNEWQKSSKSGPDGQCVQVAIVGDLVHVRNSKNTTGPVVMFTLPEWGAFVAGVKENEFDLAA
jgi:hypothetical protein